MPISPVNFQPIRFVKSFIRANKPFEAKQKKTMVDIPYSFEDYVYNNIASQYNKMDFVARIFRVPFKFAEKGDSILVNFGTKTSIFPNSASKEEIAKVVDDLIDTASKYTR